MLVSDLQRKLSHLRGINFKELKLDNNVKLCKNANEKKKEEENECFVEALEICFSNKQESLVFLS